MTVALAITCALLAAALVFERWRHDRHDERREEAWREERAELCNRIQRPDMIPRRGAPIPQPEPPDSKSYQAIGSLTAVRDEDDG